MLTSIVCFLVQKPINKEKNAVDRKRNAGFNFIRAYFIILIYKLHLRSALYPDQGQSTFLFTTEH
ncbi:hypothetical protein SAMN04487898_105314 [Pedobacter sp. ok626]|nr:hypothetical protein SAMN04487898_105314 [Pedobacter sp. ok626]